MRLTSTQNVNCFLIISGVFHFRILTPLWSVILIAFQTSSWTSGECDDSFGDRAVSQLTDSLHLEDFYHVKFPTGHLFTWFNGPHSVGCRLDQFYTPKAWRSCITDFKWNSFGYSDHHIISLKVTLGNSNPGGCGAWKFNTQLLKSVSFSSAVNNFWPAWHNDKQAFTDPWIW